MCQCICTKMMLTLQRAGLPAALHLSEECLVEYPTRIEAGFKSQEELPYHNRQLLQSSFILNCKQTQCYKFPRHLIPVLQIVLSSV